MSAALAVNPYRRQCGALEASCCLLYSYLRPQNFQLVFFSSIFYLVTACHALYWPEFTQREGISIVPLPNRLGASPHCQVHREVRELAHRTAQKGATQDGGGVATGCSLGQRFPLDSHLGFAFEERGGGWSLMAESRAPASPSVP